MRPLMNDNILYSEQHNNSSDTFNEILKLYLGSSNQTMPKLDELLAVDPEFTMGHVMRAYLLKLASDPRFIGAAKASLSAAQKLPANRRESMHMEAQQVWFDGDADRATQLLEQLLEEFPTDVLALRVAHHLHFYSGDAADMQASVARVAPHFSEGHPFHSYVLGMLSFGCEEAGDYTQAESLGRRAVELDPTDQWATHAVAHVMQMQSRFDDGIAWLNQLTPGFHNSNNFIYHIHWHEALFELGRKQPERALEIYDERLVAPLDDDFYLDVCNATSLLWRLEMLGLDVGDRWQKLSAFNNRIEDNELIFCTLHYLLTPIRLGDKETVEKGLQHLSQWQTQSSTQGRIVAEVGKPLADAISLIGDQSYTAAANEIERLLPRLFTIGGSHAQRELFSDIRDWAKKQAA